MLLSIDLYSQNIVSLQSARLDIVKTTLQGVKHLPDMQASALHLHSKNFYRPFFLHLEVRPRFGVSGANVHDPWAPNFPIELTCWNGRSVPLVPAHGASDFLIVSTAVNDAPPCYATTDISPFHTIGEIGSGVY